MSNEIILSKKNEKASGTSNDSRVDTKQHEVWIRISAFLSLKSPNTQRTYVGIVKEWVNFLGGSVGTDLGADLILKATDLHAISYKHFLENKKGQAPRVQTSESVRDVSTKLRVNEKKLGTSYNLTTATIVKKFTALRRIYKMLISANLCTLNPFNTDKVPINSKKSGQKRPTEMVAFDLVKKLINTPDENTPQGLRDKLILSLLFAGGLRRSEVANLIIDDIRESEGGTFYLKLRATKSGEDFEQALPLWCSGTLIEYLEFRKKEGALSGDKLFMGFSGKNQTKSNNKPLTTSGIYRLFKNYCKKAGISSFVSPHSARATAITKLLSDGISHREVQEFSRHSSIQMVEVYDKRLFGVDRNPGKNLKY